MTLLVLGLSAEYGAGHDTLCAGHGVLLLVLLVRSDLAQSFTDLLPVVLAIAILFVDCLCAISEMAPLWRRGGGGRSRLRRL